MTPLIIAMLHVLYMIHVTEGYETVIGVYNSTAMLNSCSYGAHYNYSIEDLSAANLKSGTLFKFCSEFIVLNRSIHLINISDVTLTGFGLTKLTCVSDREAGIVFKNIHNLELQRISIENCGVLTTVDSDPIRNIKASVTIQNCYNITLADININNSPGTGLALFHNTGSIRVESSAFKGNGHDRNSGGNGVYVETGPSNYRVSDLGASYKFNDCYFLLNAAATGKDSTIKGFSRFDKGGGMCIYIRASENVDILISNSTFNGNQAEHYGGALFITYNGRSSNNRAQVQSSTFVNNTARYGGATYNGYLHTRDPSFATPHNCSHFFETVTFTENNAYFGGGSSVFSSRTSNSDTEDRQVTFKNCSWTRNYGQHGAALAVLPNAWNLYTRGYLPTLRFVNCTVAENRVKVQTVYEKGQYNEYSKGSGAFYCFAHDITFAETSLFEGNIGTALYLDLCTSTFSKNSVTFFKNNTAYQGGAIYELSSVIYVSDGVKIHFNRNIADDRGGAIYENTPTLLIFDYSKTCFINYNGKTEVAKRNISVSFVNNAASRYGHSIYASTLVPCYNRFKFSVTNIAANFFDLIGNFTYTPASRHTELATAVNRTNITDENWSGHVLATPGAHTPLPLLDIDDFGQQVETMYLVTIHSDANISINRYYSEVSNNNLLLYGKRKETATVTLSDTSSRQNTLSFKVTMQACPPGFIHGGESQSCICAFDTAEHYVGIDRCNLTLLRAYGKEGYWIGYKTNGSENEDNLVSGYCPKGFCYSGKELPGKADRKELDELMCTESRTGILCGQCRQNFSVHFHSLNFECKTNDHCQWGWLFYILSEVIPVTVIFLLIIFFNIPFTSGLVNGFIFYCQVVEVIRFQSMDLIPLSNQTRTVDKINSLFYLSFSLSFLVHDDLSYCLWKSAKPVDMLAFKYVTLTYALFLVLLVTFVIPYCTRFVRCRQSQKISTITKYIKCEGGVIHGLSAFLILCYAQCARSSLMPLISVTIYNKGSTDPRTMVYYDGEIQWMSTQHLPYAIPAIFLALVVLALPPILLLVYPLHNKVLSWLRLSETRCTQILFSPLNKLKPFFDSFQGCFKDDYRFFSGLYFIYRFFIMLNVVMNYLQESFFFLELQLVAMLILHALCQPYKKRLHNVIDTLLIGNLAIINATTYYEVNQSLSTTAIRFLKLSSFTCALIMLPGLIAGASIILYYVHKSWKKRHTTKTVAVDDDSFDVSARVNYEPFDSF